VSGAFVAKKILESHGFKADFCNSVSSIIVSHLKPDSFNKDSLDIIEKKILYEADTIDANIGLIAFYRNIQIHTHYMLAEKGKVDFQQYIKRLEPWIQRNVSIIEKMMTKTGIQIAMQRRKKMKDLTSRLKKELENNFFKSLEYGVFGIIKLFIDNNSEPNLNEEMHYLFNEWIPERKKMLKKERNKNLEQIFQGAIDLCNLLSAEIEGIA